MSKKNRSSKRLHGFANRVTETRAESEASGHLRLYQQQVAPLRELGRLKDAAPVLRLLMQARTKVPEVYRDLSLLAEQQGEIAQAERLRDIWLSQDTKRPEQLLEQACVAEKLDRNERGLQLLEQILSLDPKHLEALKRAARLLLKLGEFTQASQHYQRWLEQEPETTEALVCFAACLLEGGRSAESEAILMRIKPLAGNSKHSKWPRLVEALQARILQKQGNEQEAFSLTEKLLVEAEISPPHWMQHRILATVLLEQHKLEELKPVLEEAIKQQPKRYDLRGMEAEALLLRGNLRAGYQALDHQQSLCKRRKRSILHGSTLPRWNPDNQDHELALIGSGTLGDTLLLSRYAVWLQNRIHQSIKLFVQPPLVRLLQNSVGKHISVDTYFALEHQQSGSALPLMSLPALFGSCQENPELQQPHLKPDTDLVKHWRDRLNLPDGTALVGLNWHGSVLQTLSERHSGDIPLEVFKPLAAQPGVVFVSLQKGIGEEQLDGCSFREQFTSVQAEINREQRLEHIAALMSLCSVVVADDSGPAHLAGCLGVPTLVLLPERINWRWGSAETTKAPWYPSVTTMQRQPNEDWSDLMKKAAGWVARELKQQQYDEEARERPGVG